MNSLLFFSLKVIKGFVYEIGYCYGIAVSHTALGISCILYFQEPFPPNFLINLHKNYQKHAEKKRASSLSIFERKRIFEIVFINTYYLVSKVKMIR